MTTKPLSAFGESYEGHTAPMCKLIGAPGGVLRREFHRFTEDLRRTARHVV